MLVISCCGTPYEIGYKHGHEAKTEVGRSIDFYAGLFKQTAKLDWPKVREIASEYEPALRKKWPAYLEEMRGLADGAGRELEDIIALNVRTEINFGLFSDGCTALSWKTSNASFLAQNWDWQEQQKQNLIILTLEQPDKPTIKMVTEAGIIGKIGMNSAGVGVLLNAIRAKGMDKTRLPCHLGLRLVLESQTRDDAIAALSRHGVASACHMLIADAGSGGTGVEWSAVDEQRLPANAAGQVFHSNHYVARHAGVADPPWLDDSRFRLARIEELCNGLGEAPGADAIRAVFTDEANYPAAICRDDPDHDGRDGHSATLFNIVMDLQARAAKVILGRPTAPEEFHELSF
ncbi:hypothetical protein MBLNU459_g5633t1 [Dothideomycetes sp. NU459]